MNMRLIASLLFVCSCASPEYIQTFIIDTSCDLSIVEGELNGKKTHFVLDTGAGITTFDLNQCKQYGFGAMELMKKSVGFTNHKQTLRKRSE